MSYRPVPFGAAAALVALALAPSAAQAAPQAGALRNDPASRPLAQRASVSANVAAEPASRGRAPAPDERRAAARDARMAALRARLDAFADADAGPDDVEERVVVFDATGALPPLHRETLATYVDLMRAGGATVVAEACAPADDVDGERLHRAVARAFESVGAAAWVVRAQPGPCRLGGGVVLRPAR